MKIIGLTGGIGSGKSTVSRFLVELGAITIDTDKIGHETFKPGTEAWHEVVDAFGTQVLTSGGKIDRKKLGDLVFADASALARLNNIMHPRIGKAVKATLEECQRQGVAVVVIEAPLLAEAGWTSEVDEVWVTVAPEAVILSRLQERAGLSEIRSLARIRSQLPTGKRLEYADIVIDTDCDLVDLKARVRGQWQRLQNDMEAIS